MGSGAAVRFFPFEKSSKNEFEGVRESGETMKNTEEKQREREEGRKKTRSIESNNSLFEAKNVLLGHPAFLTILLLRFLVQVNIINKKVKCQCI